MIIIIKWNNGYLVSTALIKSAWHQARWTLLCLFPAGSVTHNVLNTQGHKGLYQLPQLRHIRLPVFFQDPLLEHTPKYIQQPWSQHNASSGDYMFYFAKSLLLVSSIKSISFSSVLSVSYDFWLQSKHIACREFGECLMNVGSQGNFLKIVNCWEPAYCILSEDLE